MVTISILPELKGALVTRYPIWPNLFSLSFTTVTQEHAGTAEEDAVLTGEEQKACCAGILRRLTLDF